MNRLSSFAKQHGLWFPALLTIVVLVLYVPSVRFGLIWDDPLWYRQGAGQSAWQILTFLPSYQFYRPLAILLNRQLVSSNGVVNAPLAHAIQIAAHLVAALSSVPVLQSFGFARWHARLTALLFAVSPLAFQAVAWQAPQQPLTIVWLLLAILAAARFIRSDRWTWLGLSLLMYIAALLFQESALPFVLVFFGLEFMNGWVRHRRRRWWPLLHLAAAAAYVLIWLSVPRRGNIIGQGFQSVVLADLLQGTVWPLSHVMAGWATDWPLMTLTGFLIVAGLVLVLSVWKSASARSAVWSVAWIVAGLLPVWAGLSWAYVETGERLLYPASLGISALWGGVAAWTFSSVQARWRRVLGAVVLVATLLMSFQQVWQFQKLYEIGAQQLSRAVDVLSTSPQSRVLFVNFPDRIELRPRLYPLGFWGVTLAPIVQNLSDYARAERGIGGQDQSLSVFLVGADERRDWPYRVDMRGEDTPPEQLYRAALQADAVYLTRYRKDGSLGLEWVGSVRPAQSSGPMASLGDSLQLAEAQADVASGRILTLRLTWDCLKPLRENDTIFVHFWQDGVFVGDADGDALDGLVPLFVCQPGTEIVDVRQVEMSRFGAGRFEVRAGIYNRVDGTRYPARGADGQRFPDDEIPVATFDLK